MSRIGRLLLWPNGVTNAIHRLAHWRVPKDQACFVCRAAWAYLDTLPGFAERLDKGDSELRAGKGVLYSVDDLR